MGDKIILPGPDAVLGTEDDIIIETDGGGGGSSTGGGGGDGGQSRIDALRRSFRGVLFNLGLDPDPYAQLIQQAIAGEWSAAEFLWSLSTEQAFAQSFPGVEALLERGMSVGEAVRFWRGMANEYAQVAKDLGLSRVARLTDKRIGFLIENNVDPEEFGFRLGVLKNARRSEDFRLAFNRILKGRGQEQLDKQGWFKFLMGVGDTKLYDTYEATVLLQELGPEGLRVREARRLGRAIGAKGQLADLSTFSSTLERIRSSVGSQILSDAGLRTADLALAALAEQVSSPDLRRRAEGAMAQVEQLLRNQEAREAAVDRSAVYLTEGGRPISALAPAESG